MDTSAQEQIYDKALETAAKQLSYRPLSQETLRKKLLERGYPEEATEYAIAWLAERGMLDDTTYAEGLVRSYSRRGYGIRRIRQELTRHTVPREIADEVLSNVETDTDQLQSLLDKRLHGDLSDRKEVQKAIAMLQRRGFTWAEIRRALDQYGEEELPYDDD